MNDISVTGQPPEPARPDDSDDRPFNPDDPIVIVNAQGETVGVGTWQSHGDMLGRMIVTTEGDHFNLAADEVRHALPASLAAAIQDATAFPGRYAGPWGRGEPAEKWMARAVMLALAQVGVDTTQPANADLVEEHAAYRRALAAIHCWTHHADGPADARLAATADEIQRLLRTPAGRALLVDDSDSIAVTEILPAAGGGAR